MKQIDKRQQKVIHVEIKGTGRHYYFGSVAAIYEHLDPSEVGIKKESLWRVLKDVSVWNGREAIIRKGSLITANTNRGGNLTVKTQ